MSIPRTAHASFLAALAAFVGCAPSDLPDPVIGTQPGPTADAAIATAACTPGPCTCGAAQGYRTCADAGPACTCAAPLPVPTPPARIDGDCAEGQYVGNFEGAAGFVFPQSPVSGLGDWFDGAKPALSITLSKAAGGQEFQVLGDGAMHGNANGSFPFDATITGNLDCSTKLYSATIAGSVQLFLDGVRNQFTGTMNAQYDGQRHAFVNGQWTVTGTAEDGGLDFGLVGSGTWHAELLADGGAGSSLDAGADAGTGSSPDAGAGP
jgi:hypothetical protein